MGLSETEVLMETHFWPYRNSQPGRVIRVNPWIGAEFLHEVIAHCTYQERPLVIFDEYPGSGLIFPWDDP